jgi:uncharacterized protein
MRFPIPLSQPVLVVPGINGSGPEHWQSLWEATFPNMRRVRQRDWEIPCYHVWRHRLERAVAAQRVPPILVAHSLGCLLSVKWAATTRHKIRGLMLVAPPNPRRDDFPPYASGFRGLTLRRLKMPSIVVASRDDPYGSLRYAQRCQRAWGSAFVDAGAVGHINAGSQLGNWPAGLAVLRRLGEVGKRRSARIF